MNEHDHKVLEDLMGVDPTPMTPPKETGPLGVDPRKPVSDQTAAQVAAVAGTGQARRRPAVNDHPLLVLPYNPVRPRHDSVEIKHFLDERKPLRPGALQVSAGAAQFRQVTSIRWSFRIPPFSPDPSGSALLYTPHRVAAKRRILLSRNPNRLAPSS